MSDAIGAMIGVRSAEVISVIPLMLLRRHGPGTLSATEKE